MTQIGQKEQIVSSYVNVGARDVNTNKDIPTKAALKGLIGQYPHLVEMYATEAFGPNEGKTFIADSLDIGVRYSVTGPNPYTNRKWYATVEKLQNGKIKVS